MIEIDDITIKAKWSEDTQEGIAYFYSTEVIGKSDYVTVKQQCYIGTDELKTVGKKIIKFSYEYKNKLYIQFGSKTGRTAPAFSLEIMPKGSLGEVKIEVDMEIDDNDEKKHRCVFYVGTDLGRLEKFGKSMIAFANDTTKFISLNNY